MPINLITRKDYSQYEGNPYLKIDDSTKDLQYYLKNMDSVGYDKETNHLHPLKAQALTTQFGDYDTQYILDETSIPLTEVGKELSTCELIGHNLKFDYKMGVMNGVTVRNFFDTMIAEQIIAKGSGYYFNLDAVLQRRIGILPMDKDVREEFHGKSIDSLFSLTQLQYMADDVKYLHQLKEKQVEFIDRYGYHRDLYDIEFPFISLVGDAELSGFLLNENQWADIIRENELILIETKNELNAILRDLREDYPELKALRIDRKAVQQKSIELNLFIDPTIVTAPVKGSINYSSRDQVLRVWELLNLPLPTTNKKDEKLGYKVVKPSISVEALEQYLIKYPTTILREFITVLMRHGSAVTAVSTFGHRFLVEYYRRGKGKDNQLGYKLNSTGKIYTIYRQSEAETTRMKSGDESSGYYNSQNIPKLPKYRNCFLADPGYYIITIDLSGAELVIAASLSKDKKLIHLLTEGDVHSSLADYCYNKIIEYILTTMKPYRQKMELEDLLQAEYKYIDGLKEKDEEEYTKARVERCIREGRFVINKENANDIRQKFKNVNYSMIYGGSLEKIMELLNIAKEYANLVDKGLHESLPTLFSFLEAQSKFGVENGYIKFHENYGGRHWFDQVLQAKRDHRKLPFNIKGDIERACKNYPIQGTQGYMLKEASVRFYYDYVFPNNFDITPKLWVHDEHVAMALKDEAETHAKVLQKYMNDVSSSYLVEGLKMESHYNVLPYWTK